MPPLRVGRMAPFSLAPPPACCGDPVSWTRVQLEGWVREADLGGGVGASLGSVTAAEVRADPARYVGQAGRLAARAHCGANGR